MIHDKRRQTALARFFQEPLDASARQRLQAEVAAGRMTKQEEQVALAVLRTEGTCRTSSSVFRGPAPSS